MTHMFRTWDKRRNEWYGASNDEVLTLKNFHLFGECTYFCPPSVGDLQYLETDIYTGVDDLYNIHIYFNDICHVYHASDETRYDVGIVTFSNGSFYVGEHLLHECFNRCEVVGNVHEDWSTES